MDLISAPWRKSSYSGNGGNTCVEVAAAWRKSSHSGNGGATCVETAPGLAGGVAVRDSKDPDGPRLAFTTADWRAFTARVKRGEFDLV